MIIKAPRVTLNASYFIDMVEPLPDYSEFRKEGDEFRDFNRFYYNSEKNPEMFEELEKIRTVNKKRYGLTDIDIWDCRYYKDGLYIGDQYIFTKPNSNIQGIVSIVFSCIRKKENIDGNLVDKNYDGFAYYVFRTWIHNTGDNYTNFCKELVKLSNDLGLTMARQIFKHGIGLPTDVCLEPVFVKKVEKFCVESYIDFLSKIEIISENYFLYATSDIRTNFYL